MATTRWARCIHQRGEEVERFIEDFFGEAERRVLLIGGAGFDPRSTALAGKFARRLGERATALFLREERPNPDTELVTRGDKNAQSLGGLLPGSRVERLEIFASDGAAVGGRRVAAMVDAMDPKAFSDVVVDFSALSKGVSFPIVKHLLELVSKGETNANIHVMVVDQVNTDIEIRDVGSDRAALITGFEARWWLAETRERAKLWLPQLLQDQHAVLERIRQFIQPDDVCPILPFPAANLRRPDHLIEEYADEMQSVWEVDPRDVVYADEKNPLDVYRSLVRIHEARTRVFQGTGGSTVVLSPLGSKALAIGSLMAALELDCPVVYVEALEYHVDFSRVTDKASDADFIHVWLSGEAYAD
jgi:hypothetical protein